MDTRNAFLLAISPCSPYAKNHGVKGKGRWWLLQKKALQFAPLSRALRVQLFLQVSLLVSAWKISDWGTQACGAPKPKAVDDRQCTATSTWPGPGSSRATTVVSKGGNSCTSVTDSGWAYPASVRSCQLAGLVPNRLPRLTRGCINNN